MNLNDLTESEIKDILFQRFLSGKEEEAPSYPAKVQKAIARYENEKQKRYDKYHDLLKHDPVFVAKNRENAKNHYYKHRAELTEKYKQSPETAKAKNLFRYYKRQNRVADFMTKHPEKWLLVSS